MFQCCLGTIRQHPFRVHILSFSGRNVFRWMIRHGGYVGACTWVKRHRGQASCLRCIEFVFGVNFRERLCGESNVRSTVKYLAVMCLLLTLWSAIAFAAHHHSNPTEAAKCTVCVAAHSAAPKTTASLLKAKFTPISTFLPEPVFAAQSFVAFALSVRPPPAI